MPRTETLPEIPDRLYFRIGDVSQLVGVEPYVLRFWETEFPMLQPKKSKTGHREYKRKDVELLLEIKRLLYDEGFTISGARKAIRERARSSRKKRDSNGQAQLSLLAEPAQVLPVLETMKKELQAIAAILKSRRRRPLENLGMFRYRDGCARSQRL
jgi:DNA-binding transcriptional MerR regulator